MRKYNLLIVDDEVSIRKTIKAYLKQFEDQIQVIGECENGNDAIEFLKENKCDIIILDINMPKMTGLDVADYIHEQEIECIPLIFSSYLNGRNVNSALQSDVRGIIEKDDTGVSSLLPAIKSLLNGDYVFSAKVGKLLAEAYKKKPIKKIKSTAVKNLSERELEIIQLLYDEFTNKEIATRLELSVRTVESHRKNIMDKLGLKTVSGLIRFASEYKIAK